MTYEGQKIRLIMELRSQGITDTRVLSAIERIPREQFVPAPFKEQAYDNIALPISQGQTISQPYIVAYMTQELRVGDRMKVLEIGTGSGYQAAVLASLSRRLYTIERYRSLMEEAEARFQALKLYNITTHVGDGNMGWPAQAPFERIVVTAAAETVPGKLADQLADEGIMLVPVGPNGRQQIVRVSRHGDRFEAEDLLPVRFVPLLAGVANGR